MRTSGKKPVFTTSLGKPLTYALASTFLSQQPVISETSTFFGMCTFDLSFADLQPRFRTSHGLSFHRICACIELSRIKASYSLPYLSTRIRHRRAPAGSTSSTMLKSTSDPASPRLGGRGTDQLRAAGGPQNQPLSVVPRKTNILRAIHKT